MALGHRKESMKGRAGLRATAILSWVAALLSFVAVAIRFARRDEWATTPLFGGLAMLIVALGASSRLRKSPDPSSE